MLLGGCAGALNILRPAPSSRLLNLTGFFSGTVLVIADMILVDAG